MVSERISIQAKECFIGFSLELISLRFNIFRLHIYVAIVELKYGYISISIQWHVPFNRRNERIYHDSIERSINAIRNLAKNNLDATLAHFTQDFLVEVWVSGPGCPLHLQDGMADWNPRDPMRWAIST